MKPHLPEKLKNYFLNLLTLCCLGSVSVSMATTLPRSSDEPAGGRWGDQGDGTYANPIIPADYSDIDAIRVGDDYYAISSTFQFSPGVVILHSKDLVNWRIIGHAVSDLTQISPELNWDKMARYGRGIWAGSIRYHDNKYWIYFGTPDEGYFMTTALKPEGPWEPLTQLKKSNGWDDCCPFWDDDGQGYLVGTQTVKNYNIHLFKLSADGKSLDPSYDKIIHQSQGSEANKLYKIKGLYYHLFSHVNPEGRVVVMERSKSLDGPWELQQLQHGASREPNQGGLLENPDGTWWWFTHSGSSGHWDGRIANLLPVKWIDGWPMLGEPAADGQGLMVWNYKKPVMGQPIETPSQDDDFSKPVLAPFWEWNYQPRADKWSLTERPGFLRLHAFKPLQKNEGILAVGNVLTQRSLRTNKTEVTIRMETGSMADGQVAGLCHFAGTWSYFGVIQENGVRRLVFQQNVPKSKEPAEQVLGPELKNPAIYLRSTWGQKGLSQYSYSLDGKTFLPFATPNQFSWGPYRGDRVGLFTFNPANEAGAADFNLFQQKFDMPPGGGTPFEMIQK